jgi:DNA-binding CsgD family transcriptional regulator
MEKPMTRIILILDPEIQATYITDDPRSAREVMVAINTRRLVVGEKELQLQGERQWAIAHEPVAVVTVFLEPPPVELTPRQYDVLFGLGEGISAGKIARRLGISRRMVYGYTAELKARFGLPTIKEVLGKAREVGFLD